MMMNTQEQFTTRTEMTRMIRWQHKDTSNRTNIPSKRESYDRKQMPKSRLRLRRSKNSIRHSQK